jgi:serine/threonine-protein kinase
VAELSGLAEITRPEELGADALLAVASARDGLIATADAATRLESFPPSLRGAAASLRVSGAGRYQGAAGGPVLGAYAPVAGTDWYVVSTQPASVAEAVANRMKRRSALAATLALALVALGSHVAWRTIVRPLRELAVAQRRLARERARASKGDEIADLHATFSALERQLRDRDQVGQVFLGRYQVLEPIGAGGMGAVFKGWDPKLKRHVALKTVHLGAQRASETRGGNVRNLLNEALTVARFSHRNIVAIYDLEDLGDAAFVAMELVDGTTLERHLRRHAPLPPAQVVPLGVAIARGLAAAHAQRIVHRDIKPGNVLLGKDGSIKIADFGIAGALSMLAEREDMLFGTPGYIPPEAIQGAGQTERGDLFALGVMLYECLAGATPFEGKNANEIMRHTLEAPVPRLREPNAPPELAELVAGLLERDPEARRPASADSLADALGRMAVLNDWRWGEVKAPPEVDDLPAHTGSVMLQRAGLATRALALGCALLAASPLAAQPAAPAAQARDETVSYVVQPGDTLEGLTARHLGDAALWRENWKLNPDLKDPHALIPGQRIQILVKRSQHSAEIKALSRKVESKAHQDPAWTPAQVGAVLLEKDGIRTYERSSADLGFDDGSRLVVTEQSLLFLREIGARLTGTVARRQIEIVEGQAEVAARPAPRAPAGIEIVVGGARALALPAEGQGMGTRARKLGPAGAQVMVYEGSSNVQAGGASVEVARGMGTSVPSGGRPAAPEKLLEAPHVLAPVPGTAYGQSNPRFSWRPVPGARSYTVEVCADADCGQVVDRATRVAGERWSPDGLPLGELYFRVTAVSASGLDGFPSAPAPFRIDSLWRRPDPLRR